MGVQTGYLLVMTVRLMCPHCDEKLEIGGRIDLDPKILKLLGYSVRCANLQCQKTYRVPQVPSHVGIGDATEEGQKDVITSYARRLRGKKSND
jgi:hypothetical protein